ncbi:hypothetical protein KM043_006285 [Ampulex compressa]|nr:hypothetical protein KM043_006285 [Ampulex compressa]
MEDIEVKKELSSRRIKNERKYSRKQKRAAHMLLRDMNIKCCDQPTQYLMICNGGLVTGLRRETLRRIIDPMISTYDIIMPMGKSYCFLKFLTKEDAMVVCDVLRSEINGYDGPLYASYAESVPETDNDWNSELPPGLTVMNDFVTEEEEIKLLETLNWDEEKSVSSDLKHRKVKHFGYEFKYTTNMVNPNDPIMPIPNHYKFLQALFDKYDIAPYEYDQLTINQYQPGQGIPPHIDTHSVFENIILSLSLGSSIVMDFKRENQKASVLLAPRSLLIMADEARYAWTHGICPRHNDLIETKDGLTTQSRGLRTSFTFRKVRTGYCNCIYPEYCNAKQDLKSSAITNKAAVQLEQSYVHKVYEEISDHFNETRHKQWPNVTKFLESLQPGDMLLDAGCGNGKYLRGNEGIYKIGCDRSQGLIEICRSKGFEALLSDCLSLPYRDHSLDAVISIAVIHHLSTKGRRRRAISEMIRVLRPKGRCLIYVWAKEQTKNSVPSAYVKYNPQKEKNNENACVQKTTECGLTLPVHENRTEFCYSDMLVPWKKKGGKNFLRYYHVFAEGELPRLCLEVANVCIQEVYYDQGNWCVILEKQFISL